MKLLALFILLVSAAKLQAKKDTLVTYYNYNDEEVSKKDTWHHCWKSFRQADGTTGMLEYNSFGRLSESGAFTSNDLMTKTGLWVSYNFWGDKVSEGMYENNLKSGTWTTWHDNGNKESEIAFVAGLKEGAYRYWHYSGGLKTDGTMKDDKYDGFWQYWHSNGQLAAEGQYDVSKKNGNWKGWYDNGQLKYDESYTSGEKDGKCTYWHKNGTTRLESFYSNGQREEYWKAWYDNGNPDYEGGYSNNTATGEWKFYLYTGALCSIESYENGKAVKTTYLNEKGGEVPLPEVLSTDPQFPGGELKMAEFIRDNVRYPEMAREMCIQGTVYIRFMVGRDGSLSDFEILKGAHELLDKEALRVLKLMPDWIPATVHNRTEEAEFVIPINFRIH